MSARPQDGEVWQYNGVTLLPFPVLIRDGEKFYCIVHNNLTSDLGKRMFVTAWFLNPSDQTYWFNFHMSVKEFQLAFSRVWGLSSEVQEFLQKTENIPEKIKAAALKQLVVPKTEWDHLMMGEED